MYACIHNDTYTQSASQDVLGFLPRQFPPSVRCIVTLGAGQALTSLAQVCLVLSSDFCTISFCTVRYLFEKHACNVMGGMCVILLHRSVSEEDDSMLCTVCMQA